MKAFKSILMTGVLLFTLQIGFNQTLTVDNNTLQQWTINYYGETITVGAGDSDSIDISGADCHLSVSATNDGVPNCSTPLVNVGTTSLTCGSTTFKIDWSVTGLQWNQTPCSPTILDATITIDD